MPGSLVLCTNAVTLTMVTSPRLLCCTILHCTVLHCTVLHRRVLYGTHL